MRLIALIIFSMVLASCATTQTVSENADGSNGRIARNPEAAKINIQLGANYIATGQYQLADDKLKKAFKQDPKSSIARWTYAIMQEQLEQFDVAEEYYKKALAIDPNDSKGQYSYASFLCRNKRYNEADKHFKKALSNPLYSAREVTSLNAGVCAMEIPDYQSAQIYFSEVIRLNPRNRVALYQLAKSHFLQNDFGTSQSYLRDFEEVSQHTAQSLWLAFRTERGLGNNRIAQSYAKLLNNQFPESKEAEQLARLN
ncbi:MAG: type IV pilus biogenesis/stability protein PilW [Gammaproteobacteria bacterium]|nr:type IV pilus biogenesis/stability protein PilW [Gammaproteobacteria bacterium]